VIEPLLKQYIAMTIFAKMARIFDPRSCKSLNLQEPHYMNDYSGAVNAVESMGLKAKSHALVW
jgi:hypothetical protein